MHSVIRQTQTPDRQHHTHTHVHRDTQLIDFPRDARCPQSNAYSLSPPQYTCLDASSNYIVLGATSGSIYLFQRTPTVQFLQIIQNMYGPINHVAISPQEKFVTFATVKGTICVYVIDLQAAYPQIVTAHYEDTTVSCLHWRRSEEQLFYGDQRGNVFLVNLTSFLVSEEEESLCDSTIAI